MRQFNSNFQTSNEISPFRSSPDKNGSLGTLIAARYEELKVFCNDDWSVTGADEDKMGLYT